MYAVKLFLRHFYWLAEFVPWTASLYILLLLKLLMAFYSFFSPNTEDIFLCFTFDLFSYLYNTSLSSRKKSNKKGKIFQLFPIFCMLIFFSLVQVCLPFSWFFSRWLNELISTDCFISSILCTIAIVKLLTSFRHGFTKWIR